MKITKCKGFNLLNHMKQKNVELSIDYIRDDNKYNKLYFIPNIWVSMLEDENLNDEDKERLNKLLDYYEERPDLNEEIIKKQNVTYGMWKCILKINGEEFIGNGESKRKSLGDILYNNNLNNYLSK